MSFIAPNLSIIVGASIAAKLMGKLYAYHQVKHFFNYLFYALNSGKNFVICFFLTVYVPFKCSSPQTGLFGIDEIDVQDYKML